MANFIPKIRVFSEDATVTFTSHGDTSEMQSETIDTYYNFDT